MEDERLIVAVGRIERALDRIERVTDATLQALMSSERARTRLARATAETVADLDRLIGTDA